MITQQWDLSNCSLPMWYSKKNKNLGCRGCVCASTHLQEHDSSPASLQVLRRRFWPTTTFDDGILHEVPTYLHRRSASAFLLTKPRGFGCQGSENLSRNTILCSTPTFTRPDQTDKLSVALFFQMRFNYWLLSIYLSLHHQPYKSLMIPNMDNPLSLQVTSRIPKRFCC